MNIEALYIKMRRHESTDTSDKQDYKSNGKKTSHQFNKFVNKCHQLNTYKCKELPMKASFYRITMIETFSQIHYKLQFRLESLFLAIEIYDSLMTDNNIKNENIELNQINGAYLMTACLNLALKYVEIYPPPLKQIATLLKCQLQFKQYVKTQAIILKILNYNLNINTISSQISSIKQKASQTEKCHINYLLELSSLYLFPQYSWKQIIVSLEHLLNPCRNSFEFTNQLKGIPQSTIQKCSKKIIVMRNKISSNLSSWMARKYSLEVYQNVTHQSIPRLK